MGTPSLIGITLGGDTGQQMQQQEQQKKSEHAHETEADNINACSTLAGVLEVGVDKGKQEQQKKSEDETEADKTSASSILAGTLSVDTRQQTQRQEQQKKSEDETGADKTSTSSTLAGTMTWISCEPQKISSLGEATIQKDTPETIQKDTMETTPTVTNQRIVCLSLSSGVHQGTDVEENKIEDMKEEEYAYTSKESTGTCCKLNKETEAHLPIAKRPALRVPTLRSPAQSASLSMCGALRTHSRALRVPALSTLAQSASPTDKIELVKFKVGEDVEACHKVSYLPRSRTNTHTRTHTRARTHTHAHILSHTHTHTHTHTFMEARKLTHNDKLEILECVVEGIFPVSCCIIPIYLSCALSFAHAYVHTLTHTCTHLHTHL